jgi:hypothetical protein
MEETTNVIQFPLKNPRAPIKTEEQTDEVIYTAQMSHVEQAVEFVAPILFSYLSQAGFSFAEIKPDAIENDDVKNAAFLIESIRSVLSAKYNIEHPFQELAQASFQDQEGGGFKLAESVNITFKKAKTA